MIHRNKSLKKLFFMGAWNKGLMIKIKIINRSQKDWLNRDETRIYHLCLGGIVRGIVRGLGAEPRHALHLRDEEVVEEAAGLHEDEEPVGQLVAVGAPEVRHVEMLAGIMQKCMPWLDRFMLCLWLVFFSIRGLFLRLFELKWAVWSSISIHFNSF